MMIELSVVSLATVTVTTHHSCTDHRSVSDHQSVSDRWSVSHERSVAVVINVLSSEVFEVSAGGNDGDRQRSLRLSLSDLHTHTHTRAAIICTHHTQLLLAIINN